VDDEECIRNTLDDYLTIYGYKVTLARDGVEALDKLSAGEFDCIISDLMMPSMDGAQLLREIRQRDVYVVGHCHVGVFRSPLPARHRLGNRQQLSGEAFSV
jgi:CheY-like chemotaxis protein